MNIRIDEGYCYHVVDRLLNVTMSSTANMIMKLAMTKYDRLYVICCFVLVCLPKEGYIYVKC